MPKLIPYPSSQHGLSGLTLDADARLKGVGNEKKVILTYSAGGALEKILWPASLTSMPQRKDELWKHTCFEAFIKPAGQDQYWEINLSPTGDWNVYRFSSYRQGMKREESIKALNPVFAKSGENGCLTCEVWIPEWKEAYELEVGLTSVMEEASGEISYWAITHTGSQPDFHLAESFTNRIKTI